MTDEGDGRERRATALFGRAGGFRCAVALPAAMASVLLVHPAGAEGTGAPPGGGVPAADPTVAPSSHSVAGSGGDGDAVPFEGQIVRQEQGTYTVTELIGAAVAGPDGEPIGHVNDLIMSESGQLRGLVVSVGGFLGFGSKRVAIEIGRARPNTAAGGGVIVPVDRLALERAPEFVELHAADASGAETDTPGAPPE